MPTKKLMAPNALPEPDLLMRTDFEPDISGRSGSWQDIIQVLEEIALGASTQRAEAAESWKLNSRGNVVECGNQD